jgi:hypothetical protein
MDLVIIGVVCVVFIVVAVLSGRSIPRVAEPPEEHAPSTEMVCTQCGSLGAPNNWHGGHVFMVFMLCIFGILPGIGYAIVLSLRFPECRVCGARHSMIPPNTPAARRILDHG